MKRILLFALVIGLLAVQANAALFELDAATADDMRLITSMTDDYATLWFVGYNTNPDIDYIPADPDIYGSDTNIFQVGFTGNISDTDDDTEASAYIGLTSTIDLSTYDEGFLLPIANDNADTWQYKAYVTAGTDPSSNTVVSTNWLKLPADVPGVVSVGYNATAFTSASTLGFIIKWDTDDNDDKTGDQFATSVVPVPAAVILGILGLGVAGLKLRKYA